MNRHVQDLRKTDEDIEVPRFFYVHILTLAQTIIKVKRKLKLKTDVPMGYNWRKLDEKH